MTIRIGLQEFQGETIRGVNFRSEDTLAALWNVEGKLNISAYSHEQLEDLLKIVIEKADYNVTHVHQIVHSELRARGPRLHYAHHDQKNKLETSLPVYLIAFMVLLFLYVKRRQRYSHLFKFSKMSKVIYAYFATKLVFSLAYFVFLVAIFEFEFKKVRLPWIFFTYSVLRSFLSIAPYMMLALISCGYSLKFFDLWRNKKVVGQAIFMTLIFSISAFNCIWDEYIYITFDDESRFDYFEDILDAREDLAALSGIVAGLLLGITAHRTFKGTEHYRLVQKSGAIVLGVYILGPMIEFPAPSDAYRFFFHLFLPDEYYGYKVPDVVELISLPSLIYIWRDVEEGEVIANDKYSELESGNGF